MPRLTVLVMAVPVLAGLWGTLGPALEGGFAQLAEWPGLARAMGLSLLTGFVATGLSLALTLGMVAALHGTPGFRRMQRLLAPVLSLPHAAAALGLAFLIAPSGWIARALSPWATGWQVPPDILTLNDPGGIALILGLVIKEVPFLILMALAALPQTDAPQRMMLCRTLGYGRVQGFALAVLPALYPQLRLPVYAVLAYSMTAVESALILGPSLPPTLSAQVVLWMNAGDLQGRGLAAAGAVAQLALVAGALVRGNLPVTVACFVVAAAGMKAYMPAFWALPNLFLASTAAAGSVGLINSVGNLGGFLGPTLLGYVDKTTGSFTIGLLITALTATLSACLIASLPFATPAGDANSGAADDADRHDSAPVRHDDDGNPYRSPFADR